MYTLEYSSTRSEVWRWYWRAWAGPRGLWRLHVVILVTLALGVWLLRGMYKMVRRLRGQCVADARRCAVSHVVVVTI